jgi:hypothetical protein
MVRSDWGRHISSSRARWTSVPLVAAGLGGSGSRSMYENLNASGHDLNAETELGDNDGGNASPISGE